MQKRTKNMFVGLQMITYTLHSQDKKGTKAVPGMMPFPKGTNM